MLASGTTGGRRVAFARGVVYRVICNTTRIFLTRRPISDLGPNRQQMADDAAVAEAHPAIITSKETY